MMNSISEDSRFTDRGLQTMEKRGYTVLYRLDISEGCLFSMLINEDGGWKFSEFLQKNKIEKSKTVYTNFGNKYNKYDEMVNPMNYDWDIKKQFVEQYMGCLDNPDKSTADILLDYIRECTLSNNVPGYHYGADKYFIVYKPQDILVGQ